MSTWCGVGRRPSAEPSGRLKAIKPVHSAHVLDPYAVDVTNRRCISGPRVSAV